jgi:hypothetical protein
MRWNCEKQGCFNKKKRPKIEVFADCFPGRISFGDVDGIVEIAGRFLMLEWKPGTGPISRGQSIMYEKITRDKKWMVIVVAGDAEAMEIEAASCFKGGRFFEWQHCTLDGLKELIKDWASPTYVS